MLSRHLRMYFAGLVVATATALFAIPASAQDRCEGTLCDLYYANKPAPAPAAAAPQAGATPLTIPNRRYLFDGFFGGGSSQQSQQQAADPDAPVRKPMVQGGGLIGMMQGAPQDRCEGTLCDLYYGGPKPERPEPTPQRAATGAAAAPDDAAEYAPQTAEPREIERPVERHCAGTGDPWSCYRR